MPKTYLKTSRSWLTPDILTVVVDGRKLVVKDISRRPHFFRHVWARKVMKRELEAYERLQGLECVPAVYGAVDEDAFIMEHVDAIPLPSSKEKDSVGLPFFEDLRKVISEVHARGVAHGDLRKRNVLITADRRPIIIDFETATLRGEGGVRRRMFRTMCHTDVITVLKIKRKFFKGELTKAERRIFKNKPLSLRIGQFAKRWIYAPLSPKRWQKRLRNWRGENK